MLQGLNYGHILHMGFNVSIAEVLMNVSCINNKQRTKYVKKFIIIR